MFKINENYLSLKGSYLFSEINKRLTAYLAENPSADIIKLGIGDVTRPLAPSVIEAMKKAVEEMGNKDTFRGYPPERGFDFLVNAIYENDFHAKNVPVYADEIFVSDGAKSDTGNIGDIFGIDNVVAVCDPVYPVYVDTNVMAGRAGALGEDGLYSKLVYLPCVKENGFCPIPSKDFHADLIYLCYPNNPTGMTASKEVLKKWVDYANENGSVILFDAAYEAFVREENVPHSIFEIEEARTCAIEFRSFSKTAGFTGTRCAYTIIPKDLKCGGVSVNSLWLRRQSTKFNGVSYIVQRGAEATFSEKGKVEVKETIDYYLNNAKVLKEGLQKGGFEVFGGVSSPYIWLKTPNNMKSWEFFDYLLKEKQIVGTPGAGFGTKGEGYFRLTAFNTLENTLRAIDRILGK